MPSQGTGLHLDRGEKRADIVISDFKGKSASPEFKDLVIQGFEEQGFSVSYNWPYFGGRITQRYGKPQDGHHTIQIELNRALYLNESNYELLRHVDEFRGRLSKVMEKIVFGLSS